MDHKEGWFFIIAVVIISQAKWYQTTRTRSDFSFIMLVKGNITFKTKRDTFTQQWILSQKIHEILGKIQRHHEDLSYYLSKLSCPSFFKKKKYVYTNYLIPLLHATLTNRVASASP